MSDGYNGDVTPIETWEMLKNEADSVLIDVRTEAEWNYVGITDLSGIGKTPLHISWQTYPGMAVNPDFVGQVEEACPDKDAALIFICRSGVRSISTAKALTELGYTRCYNVLEGFEGDKDDADHRATAGGWKVAELPWKQ